MSNATHFSHLATRLAATERFSLGPTPTTVAVFDDRPTAARFCARFASACASASFVQLDLHTLLGDEAFAAARSMLKTGGWKNREKLRGTWHPNSPLARECAAKFSGQCYQSLKKFYGAAEGPTHCDYFWVTDAESFPYRPFNFTELVRHSLRDGRLFKPSVSWFPSRYGCTGVQNRYSDPACGAWVADQLQMRSYPAQQSAEGAVTHLTTEVAAYMGQTRFDVNNWWMYDRQMVRVMIDRAERVSKLHFVDFFRRLQTTDVAFWDYSLKHLVSLPGATMDAPNYFEELRAAFPHAFAACCACDVGRQQPCMEIEELWGECFRRKVKPARLAKFLLERLGMFGLFGNVIESAPKELLLDPRMSWAVNNAYRWRSAGRVTEEIEQRSKGGSNVRGRVEVGVCGSRHSLGKIGPRSFVLG